MINGIDIDKYFRISTPSNLPGNINFIIGSAIKKSPKKHGTAITDESFNDKLILFLTSPCFLKK